MAVSDTAERDMRVTDIHTDMSKVLFKQLSCGVFSKCVILYVLLKDSITHTHTQTLTGCDHHPLTESVSASLSASGPHWDTQESDLALGVLGI